MKKTININDNLDKRIQTYINENNMTYTSLVNLACENYLNAIPLQQKVNEIILQALTTNNGKNIK